MNSFDKKRIGKKYTQQKLWRSLAGIKKHQAQRFGF